MSTMSLSTFSIDASICSIEGEGGGVGNGEPAGVWGWASGSGDPVGVRGWVGIPIIVLSSPSSVTCPLFMLKRTNWISKFYTKTKCPRVIDLRGKVNN